MMKYKTLILASVALMTFSHNGWTDMADDDAEATIRLMGNAEAQSSDDVTKTIALPQHLLDADPEAQANKVEKSAKGLESADQNRNKEHSDNASEQAQEARAHGKEMSENAKENRANRGRSEEAPGRPDDPGRPDNP